MGPDSGGTDEGTKTSNQMEPDAAGTNVGTKQKTMIKTQSVAVRFFTSPHSKRLEKQSRDDHSYPEGGGTTGAGRGATHVKNAESLHNSLALSHYHTPTWQRNG